MCLHYASQGVFIPDNIQNAFCTSTAPDILTGVIMESSNINALQQPSSIAHHPSKQCASSLNETVKDSPPAIYEDRLEHTPVQLPRDGTPRDVCSVGQLTCRACATKPFRLNRDSQYDYLNTCPGGRHISLALEIITGRWVCIPRVFPDTPEEKWMAPYIIPDREQPSSGDEDSDTD